MKTNNQQLRGLAGMRLALLGGAMSLLPGAIHAQNPANIAGTWTARNGAWVYQITQNGPNFHWERNPRESANGTITGFQLSANWGTGSGTARVTQLDANNVPVRIEWSSGEVFVRQSTAGAGVANISGTWYGRAGAWVYQFTQNGNRFGWQRNPPETASGTITGNQLSANWGTGQGTGRITAVDANNVATRIQWDNGEVLVRIVSAPPPLPPTPSPGPNSGSSPFAGYWSYGLSQCGYDAPRGVVTINPDSSGQFSGSLDKYYFSGLSTDLTPNIAFAVFKPGDSILKPGDDWKGTVARDSASRPITISGTYTKYCNGGRFTFTRCKNQNPQCK